MPGPARGGVGYVRKLEPPFHSDAVLAVACDMIDGGLFSEMPSGLWLKSRGSPLSVIPGLARPLTLPLASCRRGCMGGGVLMKNRSVGRKTKGEINA